MGSPNQALMCEMLWHHFGAMQEYCIDNVISHNMEFGFFFFILPCCAGFHYSKPEGVVIKQEGVAVKQEKMTDHGKVRKKRERFGGMPEEEVAKKTLPDLICPNLDILIVSKISKNKLAHH